MFKLMLFVHDHVFRVHGTAIYSGGQFPYAAWNRYLDIAENLTVLARSQEVSHEESLRLNRSDGPAVSFSLLSNSGQLRRAFGLDRVTQEHIKRQVDLADAVCVRLPSVLGPIAIAACTSLNKPFAVEVVGSAFDALWNYGSVGGKVYAPIAELKARLAISKSPYAIYVTRRYLQVRYPQKKALLTSSASNVDITVASEALLARRIERILARERSSVKLGLIGTLNSQYKGIQFAVHAIRLLRARGVNATLAILGGGDSRWLRAEIRKAKVDPYIELSGVLPRGGAVDGWLDDVDIYVQPSLTEGLPRALIEAMARGLPCIGTSVGGIPELLSSEYLVPPRDSDALAEAIHELIRDPTRMLEASRQNYEAAKRYDRDTLENIRRRFWRDFLTAERARSR